MNLRLPLILLVVAVSFNTGESWGFSSFVKKAIKKALPYAKAGAKLAYQNRDKIIPVAAKLASGDEDFLAQMKSLKLEDQDAYDQAIDSFRSDFSSMMTDDQANDIINDLESLIAMDDGIEKETADQELADKFISSLA